jgi:hypothetical protein
MTMIMKKGMTRAIYGQLVEYGTEESKVVHLEQTVRQLASVVEGGGRELWMLGLRVPLIGRRISFEPLTLDVRKAALLALLWTSEWLIMHLLALNVLRLLQGTRRRRNKQSRDTTDWSIRAVTLSQEEGRRQLRDVSLACRLVMSIGGRDSGRGRVGTLMSRVNNRLRDRSDSGRGTSMRDGSGNGGGRGPRSRGLGHLVHGSVRVVQWRQLRQLR